MLQINYPNWLANDGRVKLNTKRDRTWLNKLTFGQLGRASLKDDAVTNSDYAGATKTQIVRSASQLRLPTDNAAAPIIGSSPVRRSGVNLGLGLPESSTEQVSGQGSANAAAREATVDPQNTNPTRRTTLPNEDGRDRINIGGVEPTNNTER